MNQNENPANLSRWEILKKAILENKGLEAKKETEPMVSLTIKFTNTESEALVLTVTHHAESFSFGENAKLPKIVKDTIIKPIPNSSPKQPVRKPPYVDIKPNMTEWIKLDLNRQATALAYMETEIRAEVIGNPGQNNDFKEYFDSRLSFWKENPFKPNSS